MLELVYSIGIHNIVAFVMLIVAMGLVKYLSVADKQENEMSKSVVIHAFYSKERNNFANNSLVEGLSLDVNNLESIEKIEKIIIRQSLNELSEAEAKIMLEGAIKDGGTIVNRNGIQLSVLVNIQ